MKAADEAGNEEDARKLARALEEKRGKTRSRRVDEAPKSGESAQGAGELEEGGVFLNKVMPHVNKGIAETLGAPVDLTSAALHKVSFGLVPEDSFGGSESIRRGMANIGIGTPDREPEGFGENIGAVAGEVTGFAVPLAALARRYRNAENVGGSIMRAMDDAAVRSPGKTLAAEGAGTVGAGVGRTLAKENDMGPGGQLTSEVVGGLAGPAALSASGVNLMRKGGRWALRQMFPNAEREASRRIRSLVQDEEAAARSIEDLKGTNLLPSARTQEPGLMALERTVLDQDPAMAADVARRTSESMDSLVQGIRRSGNVQDARKFIDAKRQRLKTALDARIEKASERAAKALGDVGEEASSAELGVLLRDQMEEALADARVQEQMLWQAVPQNTAIPVSSVKKTYNQLRGSLSQAQKADMPAAAREVIEGFGKKQSTPLREADGLYKKLGETARIARKDGNRNQARIAEQLRESILEDIGRAQGSPEVKEALQTARAFSRQMMDRFRKGPVGKVLETDATGAPRVPPERTLEQTAGQPGTKGRLAAEAVAGAAGEPQAMEAVQRFLKRRFSDAAVTDGRVVPARAEAFMRQNKPLLEKFPHLKDQLRAARTSEDVARRVKKSSDAMRTAFDSPAVSDAARFLGAPVDQEVKRIFASQDPERVMGEIAKMARKDRSGKALEGIKAGVTDHLLDRVTVSGLDNFGRNPVSGQGLRRSLDDGKTVGVLRKVFSEDELRKMRRSADMLAAVEKSANNKAKLDELVPRGMGEVLSIPMRVLGAKLGAKVAQGGPGVSLQAAQLGSSKMSKIWDKLTVGQAERIVSEAVKDPEVMKHLLLDFSDATPQQLKANERFFRNWALSRPLGLFDDEDGGEGAPRK